jgi:hypothetical protein
MFNTEVLQFASLVRGTVTARERAEAIGMRRSRQQARAPSACGRRRDRWLLGE